MATTCGLYGDGWTDRPDRRRQRQTGTVVHSKLDNVAVGRRLDGSWTAGGRRPSSSPLTNALPFNYPVFTLLPYTSISHTRKNQMHAAAPHY